jgi:ribosomal protein S6
VSVAVVQEPPIYDLTLLLDPEAPEDLRTRVVDEVERAITSEGSLVGRHDWGRRHTAYPIRHKEEAEYRLFQFRGPPTLLESLGRSLRITDGVVRFRLIKLAPGTPPPPELRPEPRPEPRAEPRAEPSPSARPEAAPRGRSEATAAPAESEATAAPAESEATAAPAESEATAAPAESEATAAPAESAGGSESQA